MTALFFISASLLAQPIPGIWQNTGPEEKIAVELLASDPLQPQILFLGGTENGLLRSIDGGVTWAQAAPPLNAGLIGAFYASGNRLYAGFGDDLFGNPTPDQTGLFWSGDHGGNWQLFPELYGLVINSVVQIGTHIVVGASTRNGAHVGLYHSPDNGETWHQTPPPTNSGQFKRLFAHRGTLLAGSTNSVFFSADSGETWTASAIIPPQPIQGRILSIAALDSVLFVADYKTLFESRDGGQTLRPTGLQYNNFTSALALEVIDGNLYVAVEDHIFLSADTGRTFIPGIGLPDSIEYHAVVEQGGTLIAGARYDGSLSIYRSSDGGSHWESVTPPAHDKFNVLRMLATEAGIFFGTSVNNLSGYVGNGLFVSRDQGDTWFPREVNVGQQIQGFFTDSPFILAYGSGIHRSVDGGQNWVTAAPPLHSLRVETVTKKGSLLLAGTSDDSQFLGINAGLYTSSDGLNWLRTDPPLDVAKVYDILVTGPDILAASDRGLFTSTDGSSWTPVAFPGAPYLSLLYYNGMYYAGTEGGGVLQSTAIGGTWQQAAGAIATKNIEHLFVADGILYAATRSNGLYRSVDGLTWASPSLLMSSKTVNDMAVFQGKLYAATGSTHPLYGTPRTGLFVSADSGQNWSQVPLPRPNLNYTDLRQVNDVFYVSGERQYLTRNGLHWTPLSLGLQTDRVNSLEALFLPGEIRLLAATENGVFIQSGDQDAPAALNLAVADGTALTSETSLSLRIEAEGADSLILSEDSTFADALWRLYGTIQDFQIGSGDGEKHIFAQFKDLSWNTSGKISTTVTLDTQPPAFAAPAPPGTALPDSQLTIVQQASDLNLAEVALYFRRPGEPFNESRRSIFAGDSAVVDGVFIQPGGLDFRIIATDLAGLSDTLGNGPLSFFSLPVILAAGDLGSSPGLPGGTAGSAFRIVSAPMQLDQAPSPATLFGDLGTYGPEGDWLAWQYAGGGRWTAGEQSTLSTGEGLFLLLRSGRTVTNRIAGASAKTSAGVIGDIPGWQLRGNDWTLIGNPYNTRIELSLLKLKQHNLRLSETDSTFQVWTYDGRAENAGWTNQNLTLEPWGGLAIYVSRTDTLVFANPEDPYRPLPGLNKSPSPAPFGISVPAEDSWQIQIRASGNGFSDVHNYLGVQPGAKTGIDVYDGYEPPLLPGGISVCLTRPESRRMTTFSSDIRPAGMTGYAWELQVRAAQGSLVTLNFSDVELIPSHFQAMLIDPQTNLLRDLRQQPQIETRIPESESVKKFNLLIGNPAFIQSRSSGLEALPQQFHLSQNYPNPFNPTTVIRYALPQRGRVTLKIYDILGREVLTLSDRQLKEAGYYETVADLRRFSSGVFFYRITVEGEKQFQDVKKMLLVK